MKFLYIFPHPDDESFGPAAAIHAQLKAGHEAHLYIMTRGGATIQRHRLGLSVEEMGQVRFEEMLEVEKVLNLTSMVVHDYPDSGMKEMDPRVLERAVEEQIHAVQPDVVVSYPVHGVSGFHDHLVMHAVIKRVFLEMRDAKVPYFRRLAFLTLPDAGGPAYQVGGIRLKLTEKALIDCVMPLTEADQQAMKDGLSCYKTYQETIQLSRVVERIGDRLHFELFNEDFDPPLSDLTQQLPEILDDY